MCRKKKRIKCLLFLFLMLCAVVWLYCEIQHPEWRLTEIRKDTLCNASFSKTVEDVKRQMLSCDLSKAEPYLEKLVPISRPAVYHKVRGSVAVEIPVFVSAASSNHYEETILLIEHINSVVKPEYTNMKFYFFDIGLEEFQSQKVRDLCNCTVLKFPFSSFPSYFEDLNSYCWKPVIIKIALLTNNFVMWMDTSVRFQQPNLDHLFIQAKQQGVMAARNNFSVASHTHQDTFNFLQETPCLFRSLGEFQGSLVLFHSSHTVVYDLILQPWVACALIEDCMKTKHYSWWIIGCKGHRHYHECHRFDQSVLNILIYRVFHKSYSDHVINESFVQLNKLEHKFKLNF